MKAAQAKQSTAKYIIAGLVSAFLFGAATPASKALLGTIQPQLLAGLLYLGAPLGEIGVAACVALLGAERRHHRERQALLLHQLAHHGVPVGVLFCSSQGLLCWVASLDHCCCFLH